MDKLLTNFQGGFPFTLDDIRYNDEAYRYAFNNIIKAFAPSGENFIISGCDITASGNQLHTTEGLIYLEGEIIRVDEQAITISGWGTPYFTKATSFDPAGNKVFYDGSTHQTYRKDRGVLHWGTPQAGTPIVRALLNTGEKNDWMHRIGRLLEPDWIYPQLLQGFTNDPDNPVRYRKNLLGQLEIMGQFEWDGITDDPVFILPAGYRPEKPMQVLHTSNYGSAPRAFLITTDGRIEKHQGGESWYSNNNGAKNYINLIVNLK